MGKLVGCTQAVTYHDVHPNIDVRYYSDGIFL